MSLCSHFNAGNRPYRVVLVLDDHLGPTEALVRCNTCDRPYLLEMLDWQGDLRLYRLAEPEERATATLLRDLDRGSCDLNRAGEEARQFVLTSSPLPELLLVDTRADRILKCAQTDQSTVIPRRGWRELPCDGEWIRQFQDARL